MYVVHSSLGYWRFILCVFVVYIDAAYSEIGKAYFMGCVVCFLLGSSKVNICIA